MPAAFHVLFLCSGNICRSPLAEQIFRARTLGSGIVASSAGTIAQDGAAMDPEAAALSLRYGGDPSAHSARLVDPRIVMDADLILTATRAHRAAVVQLVPRAARRAFTIREFSRLLAGLGDSAGGGDPFEVVEAVRSLRGAVERPEDPAEDDIEDPYQRSVAVHERVAELVNAQTERIAARLLLGGRVR